MEQTQTDIKHIQLNDLHKASGAKMVPFAGFLMPVKYSSELEEHNAVRNKVGIFDVSHMGEFFVKGFGALDFIQRTTSNDASKLSIGKVQYSTLTNDSGGIIDDLLVYKIQEDEYMLVVNAGNIEKDFQWLSRQPIHEAKLSNHSDYISLFALQGPFASELLQKITKTDLKSMSYYSFQTGEVGGIANVIVSATGYTGAGGFELYVKNEHAEDLWKKIIAAGNEFDLKPCGLGARDTLRLEMGYCLYGNDINEETTPLEAGLGWITKFSKDFIGKTPLLKQKEEGVKRKLVGFKMTERGIPRGGYELLNTSGTSIGQVTSGTQSPSLGIGIGMGYVTSENAIPGKEILVRVRNKDIKAEVTKMPFYNN
ncbi:MAG: glycine cleavage system aminomethyltransferase GcvT [Cytophagaceae bacterium]